MSVQHGLDRKARTAVTALVLVVVAILSLMLWSCIVAFTPEQVIAETDAGDNQVVQVGQGTMVFEPGSVGGKIAQWLSAGATRTQAFVIGDPTFVAGSDDFSPAGWVRFGRFVDMMKADRDLNASVLVTAYDGGAEDRLLAGKRADRIRAELMARGISGSRISSSAQLRPAPAKGKQPAIVLVLSK